VPAAHTLSARTTLHVGGAARAWVVAETDEDAVNAVLACDASGTPVLVLGGGSNMLVADEGFDGTVVEMATRGVETSVGDEAVVTAKAGEAWDDLVATTVHRGWSGIEALSGIPGLAGATPIQNVGAYGQDIGQVVSRVRALDRSTGEVRSLDHGDCAFGYRSSVFKQEPARWVVLDVTLHLSTSRRSVVHYAELARALGLQVGDEADVDEIRGAVLQLRRRKGMVLDEADADTRSAGSFFTNPVVSADVAEGMPVECPRYPSEAGVKLSAAWLIEQSGIERGWRVRASSPARVSSKHTLALVNESDASADDVLELARAIRDRVQAAFGITLRAEVSMVNCAL
jgi:UDP-N-acetylmuramate dehydrogenase